MRKVIIVTLLFCRNLGFECRSGGSVLSNKRQESLRNNVSGLCSAEVLQAAR